MAKNTSNEQESFEKAIKTLLHVMKENPNREGLIKTPNRVYEAMKFLCSGYEADINKITKNAFFESDNQEMVIVRDVELYSTCEHHLLPIIGKAHIAYIPDGKVIGLSKIPRILDVFARRLQLQERLTEQVATALNEALKPKGVAVMIEARHMCMEARGVQKNNSTTCSSSYKGQFATNKELKNEFLHTLHVKRSRDL